MVKIEADRVREHYDRTIDEYDTIHGDAQDPEHIVCLEQFWRFVRPVIEVNSILDVGCGTGRGLAWIAAKAPSIKLTGIDPSSEMCARAAKRVPEARVGVGDGKHLDFPDKSFDVVLATGIMHHIGNTKPVLHEMFRVARHAVIVSDHNDFAMGSNRSRRLRLALHMLGLLGPINYIMQGFRRQRFSKEDGWFYPYSILDDYDVFSENTQQVLVLPTRIRGHTKTRNFVTRQSHICLIGLK